MNSKKTFWQNFSIDVELQVAGTFIYNGLLALDEMENFDHPYEVAECLYHLSHGISRLASLTLSLMQYDGIRCDHGRETTIFACSLRHIFKRIGEMAPLLFSEDSNKLLALLSSFEQATSSNSGGRLGIKEYKRYQKSFIKLLEEITGTAMAGHTNCPTPNNPACRMAIGEPVEDICGTLYNMLTKRAAAYNTITSQLHPGSKAYKIFIQREFTFEKERLLQKELLVFILQNLDGGWPQTIFNQLTPLPFDQGLICDYLNAMFSLSNQAEVLKEMDNILKDTPQLHERRKLLATLHSRDCSTLQDRRTLL